ncbi:GntR family transcriptional regulator, partial [Vogesella mureinivorans]|uniref:GntR family transcriptional regulator n=1 Tax=Vogesella mureinivorans TaxID=657276 RepID=UPI001980E152
EFRLVSDLNDQYIDRFTGKYNGQPLPPGTEVFAYESLDSGRELAEQLGLNRNTVAAAYKSLVSMGIVVSKGRLGTQVKSKQSCRISEGFQALNEG